MYSLVTAMRPNIGWFLILPLFAAVIIGDIGNPYGAIAVALIISISQELSTPWLGSQSQQGVALFIIILVLLLPAKSLFKSTL